MTSCPECHSSKKCERSKTKAQASKEREPKTKGLAKERKEVTGTVRPTA